MEPSGPPVLALAAGGILAAVALSFLLLRLLQTAWAVPPDACSRAHLKWVYWSFLVMAAPFLLFALAVVLEPWSRQFEIEHAFLLYAFLALCLFLAFPAALFFHFGCGGKSRSVCSGFW